MLLYVTHLFIKCHIRTMSCDHQACSRHCRTTMPCLTRSRNVLKHILSQSVSSSHVSTSCRMMSCSRFLHRHVTRLLSSPIFASALMPSQSWSLAFSRHRRLPPRLKLKVCDGMAITLGMCVKMTLLCFRYS